MSKTDILIQQTNELTQKVFNLEKTISALETKVLLLERITKDNEHICDVLMETVNRSERSR